MENIIAIFTHLWFYDSREKLLHIEILLRTLKDAIFILAKSKLEEFLLNFVNQIHQIDNFGLVAIHTLKYPLRAFEEKLFSWKFIP